MAKYGIQVGASDLFGVKGRHLLRGQLPLLPPHTRYVTEGLLQQIDALDEEIQAIEGKVREVNRVHRLPLGIKSCLLIEYSSPTP